MNNSYRIFIMHWTHAYFSLLVLVLNWYTLEGKCTAEKTWRITCNFTDEEELFAFFPDRTVIEHSYYYFLKIENSNLPHLETLPMPPEIDYQSELFLTIKKSEVKTISPKCFEKWISISLLDLSCNEVRETNFLKDLGLIDELNLSYNKIEHLDRHDFKEVYLNAVNLSHNSIHTFNDFTNDNVRILDISHNSLTELGNKPLSMRHIEYIDLSYNKLREISNQLFSKSKYLKFLNVAHNELISLDVQVEIIVARNNNLTQYDITKIEGRSIDLSNNKINTKPHIKGATGYIKLLDYSNNSLQKLNFLKSNWQQQVFIRSLILKKNNLTQLHPHDFINTAIELLDLSENNIEHLDSQTFRNSNLNGTLDFNKNKLKQLNSSTFSDLSTLKVLNLSFNPIEHIEDSTFHNLVLLESLDLSHCVMINLTEDIFKNLSNLQVLNLSNNMITSVPERIFEKLNLQELDLSHNSIKFLPNNLFSGLVLNFLNLGFNEISGFTKYVFNNSYIQELTLEGLSFHDIDQDNFAGLDHLIFLNLSNNGVGKVHYNSFEKLIKLRYLYLDNNLIERLPKHFLADQVNLKSLSLKGNNISHISLDAFSYKVKLQQLIITIKGDLLEKRFLKLIYLEDLNIVDSDIKNIHNGSFRGLIRLRTLSFENSNISKIEPGAFIGLRKVWYLDTKNLFRIIKTIKSHLFKGLESLNCLNLSSIDIGTIENDAFVGLEMLEILELSKNKINNLPKNAFLGLENLKILDLSNNNLTGKQSTFPIGIFRALGNLTELHLQHNRIIKFQIGEFSNLNNLQFLNLSHNHLSYLDRHLLFPLKNLQVLDINSNYVIKYDYTFTIKHLPQLKTIGIGSNKWRCENLTIMLDQFELTNVDYLGISKLEYEMGNIDGIHCIDVCSYLYCPTEEDLGFTH